MRNTIVERFDLLKRLGGLPEPEVINEEWLYILKEETRNSILIEGFFVSEEELEEVLASGKPYFGKFESEFGQDFNTAFGGERANKTETCARGRKSS